MADPGENPFLPRRDEDDDLFDLLTTAIGFADNSGFVTGFIRFFIRSPYERRVEAWIKEVARSLARIERRLPGRIRAAVQDESFTTILLAATQAAASDHRRMKHLMLASAVSSAAEGSAISVDRQTLFIRFVDELSPNHITLLQLFATRASRVAIISGYPELQRYIGSETQIDCTEDECRLFCNDLQARALVRFSDTLDDFPGISERTVMVAEGYDSGPRILVTPLGRDLLAYVAAPSV